MMVLQLVWVLLLRLTDCTSSRAKSKVIILLTDGVNNSGFIDPKIAAELASEFNIKTYTIGIGSNGNARAPVGILPNGKFQYGITKVEIDEKLLRRLPTKQEVFILEQRIIQVWNRYTMKLINLRKLK